jgi:hypothetical protein
VEVTSIFHVYYFVNSWCGNHKTVEERRMAEIGMILAVQRSLILGRVTEKKAVRTHILRNHTEDIDKEHGPENVLN